MRFDPKATPCLAEGIYSAEIVKAEEKQSKSGNDMLEVTWKVWANDGSGRSVKDWFVSHQPWKLKGLCKILGPSMMAKFDAGSIGPNDLEGSTCRVKLRIDEQDGYEPKNSVAGYEPGSAQTGAKSGGSVVGKHEPLDESDIPF